MALSNNIGIFITDHNGIIKSINDYVMILTNKINSDVRGKHISEFLDEDNKCLIVEGGEKKHIFFDKSHLFIGNEEHFMYYIQDYSQQIEGNPIINSIMETSNDAILIIEANKQNNVIFVSPGIKKLGVRRIDIINKNFLSLTKRDNINSTKQLLDDCKRYRKKIEKEVHLNNINIFNSITNKNDVKEVFADAQIYPIISSENIVTHFCITLRELEITNNIYKNLKMNEQLLKSLFRSNPDMIFSLDINFLLKNINDSLTETTNYTEDDLIGKPFTTLFDIKHFKTITKMLLDIKDTNVGSKPLLESSNYDSPYETTIYGFNLYSDEFIMMKKDGTPFPVKLTLFPIHYNGRVTGIYGVARDITQNKKNEQTILNIANEDSLTKLPNRRNFEEKLKKLKYKSDNPNSYDEIALVFFDLDSFKSINDKYGHDVGDDLLIGVSNRINDITDKDKCFLSRISGDEFTIIIDRNKMNDEEIEEYIKEIVESFSKDFSINNKLDLMVTCSIGVAKHPQDADNYEDLIRYADLSMYESKRKGKNTYTFFDKKFLESETDNSITKESILQGMKENQFKLFYQPIINFLDYDEKLAAEALIRWEHPTKGLIFPGDFITLAESTNIIHNLGLWVLKEACLQQKEWENQGKKIFPISVNVSGRQLIEEGFVDKIKNIFKETEIDPSLIILEITESVSIENSNGIRELLKEIKKTGCKIAVDDFGTGYSSLTYLKDFPADFLKIDKSFTTNIENNERLKGIVESIVRLGHKLGLVVIAEGVETKEEAIPLTKSGVDYIQGYIFARPMNSFDFSNAFHKVINPPKKI